MPDRSTTRAPSTLEHLAELSRLEPRETSREGARIVDVARLSATGERCHRPDDPRSGARDRALTSRAANDSLTRKILEEAASSGRGVAGAGQNGRRGEDGGEVRTKGGHVPLDRWCS